MKPERVGHEEDVEHLRTTIDHHRVQIERMLGTLHKKEAEIKRLRTENAALKWELGEGDDYECSTVGGDSDE